MALAKLANGIDELHGAIDSVKEGKKRRARLVCRWCDYGPGSYAEDGSKLHQLFYMRFPEGPRSEGYQRNFNMILAAQRMGHDIERVCYHPEEFGEDDIAQARIWQQKYAEYRATFAPDCKQYKHFYNWMFNEIYQGMRKAELGNNP